MRTFCANVVDKTLLTPHLIRVTLGGAGLDAFESTGIPDEYTRLLIAPDGAELVMPQIDADWTVSYPEAAVEPLMRVYTISDFRIVDGARQLDVDIVIHDDGVGSRWALNAAVGDEVGLLEPHGLHAAPADVRWQLLVADITGMPAVSRILRSLSPDQSADVTVVLTDERDQIVLASAGATNINWVIVDDESFVADALVDAVRSAVLPDSDRYVWFAGVAQASRAVRKYLRRDRQWPQADFYTCGYWQFDAAAFDRIYAERREEIAAELEHAKEASGGDEGLYLDKIDEIYESVGL